MHRLLRDIAAGVQTLRFLTALVCSAAVTTAVAGPMAYQALSFDPQAAVLGTASNTTRAPGPPDPTGSLPRQSTSTAAPTTATTAAPTTTLTPTTLPATTAPPPSMAATTEPAAETNGPASTPTVPPSFEAEPPPDTQPEPSVTSPPSTTVPVGTTPTVVPTTTPAPPPFVIVRKCKDGEAVELDENQDGTCADEADQ